MDNQAFLKDWNEDLARQFAAEMQIELNNTHWQMIHALRKFYLQYHKCPSMRMFVKYCQNEYDDSWNSAKLYELFEEPLRQGSRIAGLPKPPHCL